MSPSREDPRGLIRYALVGAALTVVLLWTLYLARAALLLIYLSALVAIGLGPLLSAIPAIAVALTVSPTLALGGVVFYIAQQQLENHVLVPKIMERQVGVNAAGVIIALLLGGSLLGAIGAILAVPTAAILQVIFEELAPESGEH